MPNVLTSWKEIAQYLGKAVRTVQRWELDFGLPVRRSIGQRRQTVIAIPEEIDAWMHSRMKGTGGAVADFLRQELALLRAETDAIRRRLEQLESRPDRASAKESED